MAIKVKGLEIETGKLYDEYTETELLVLPLFKGESTSHVRLGYDGEWYLDEDM